MLEPRIAALRLQIAEMREGGATGAADPVGEFYAWATRGLLSVRDVGFGFPLFFALLIEVVSAFGPITIARYAELTRPGWTAPDNVQPAGACHGRPRPAPARRVSIAVNIKLPYVHTDRDTRSGQVRVYFRRRLGAPKIRLRALPGSAEFLEEYKAALEAGEKPDSSAKPRTYRWLCIQYFGSAEFRELDPRTQRTRRGILEATCLEPTAPGATETFANFPLNRMTGKAIRVLRDRKADFPEGANNRVKAVRRMFAWAIEAELVASNPARDVAYKRRATEGHHTWTEEEIAQFEAKHPVGSKARLALALLMYTGVRRSDVVLLGRQHVRKGWLKFTAQKGRNRKPVTVEIPVIAALEQALELGPTGELTFLMTEQRKPFTAPGFGNWFRDRCNEAGLPQCSAHGLRKAGAALAAENGATVHELMPIFGWLTMKEAERYTQAARRKRLARNAGQLLVRAANETSPQGQPELPRTDQDTEN